MPGGSAEPWTVLRLLNWTKDYFARAGLDSPRLAAEVLLAHVLECKRIDLYARFDHEPEEARKAAFRDLVRRAAAGEPVAYLVGVKEFYSLSMVVSSDVMIPRPETEILVSEALDHLKRPESISRGRPRRLWDVCTGSGCVAVATAVNCPQVEVLATDASAEALAVARKNVERHGLAGRVRCERADLLTAPEGCEAWADVDVITANPPYVAAEDEIGPEVRAEPPAAVFAGEDGLDVLRPLIAQAPDRLAPGGSLILEFGRGQADAVRDLIVQARRNGAPAFEEPRILRDHQGIERSAAAMRRA